MQSDRELAVATEEDVAREWHRRAERGGLARVMRASQPSELNAGVTECTRQIVSDYLKLAAGELGRRVSSVLEVGCGVGRLTPVLGALADHVTAVDMTPTMLDAARATCAPMSNVDFVLSRAEDYAPRRHVDVSVSVWVLMHVLDDERLAKLCHSLAESSRYLVLIEYADAEIPVSRWSRLRDLDQYLALLPGAEVVAQRLLDYGGDRSTAALIRFSR